MARKISLAKATELWDEMRSGLVNLEKQIKKAIATRAWEPMGYASFAAAWEDRMAGVKLADAVKPVVIYTLLDEGHSLTKIEQTTGFGMDQVERVAEQHAAGDIPAEAATVHRHTVRQHTANNPSAPTMVHVEVGPDELRYMKEAAESRGVDFQEECHRVLIEHFKALRDQPRVRSRRAA